MIEKIKNIQKWKIFTAIGLVTVAIFIAIEIESMYISKKWDDNIGELLVGTTLEVVDEDNHHISAKIETADQVQTSSVEWNSPDLRHVGLFKNKYLAKVDVETETGIIQGVYVDVVVPLLFVDKTVKWYYTSNDEGVSDVSFNTEKMSVVYVRDVINSLGASESSDIMAVAATGVSNNYDAIEFCAIYMESDNIPRVSWTRLEYDYNSKTWNWCQAVDKNIASSIGMAYANLYDFGFRANNDDYQLDDIVYVAPSWTDILK